MWLSRSPFGDSDAARRTRVRGPKFKSTAHRQGAGEGGRGRQAKEGTHARTPSPSCAYPRVLPLHACTWGWVALSLGLGPGQTFFFSSLPGEVRIRRLSIAARREGSILRAGHFPLKGVPFPSPSFILLRSEFLALCFVEVSHHAVISPSPTAPLPSPMQKTQFYCLLVMSMHHFNRLHTLSLSPLSSIHA